MEMFEDEKKKSFLKGIGTGVACSAVFFGILMILLVVFMGRTKNTESVKNENSTALISEEVSSAEASKDSEEGKKSLLSGLFTSSEFSYGELLDKETYNKCETIYEVIAKSFLFEENIDADEIRDNIYRAIINSLGDVYTVYYDEEELSALMDDGDGIYYGIGAYVSWNSEMLLPTFSGIFKGAPSEAADIRDGDQIYAVFDEPVTQDMSLDDVVSLIKGPEGTEVTITILRGDELIEKTLTRAKVETPTVSYEMEEENIGYIQITEFDDVTTNQFKEAYKELETQGMTSLIIDLRSNPGGNLSTVLDIARQLLPKGVITYTIDINDKKEEYLCDGKNAIDIPLVVLINGYSASASELLTGAVRDYGVGTIIGTNTYGKGIVQDILTFSDNTGIKITTSRYYTPNGECFHGYGIAPDIEVTFDSERYYSEEAFDNQKEYAIKYLEDRLDDYYSEYERYNEEKAESEAIPEVTEESD